MAKENTILVIDVGGNSLKMAEFLVPVSGGLVLKDYAIGEYADSLGDTDFLDRFLTAYRTMLAEHKFVSKRVRVSISGQHAFSRLCKLPALMEKQQSQVQQIIEFEAKQTVPYPLNEVVWDYQLLHHVVESGAEDQPPENELEALFVAVKSDLISGIADVIQDSGKDIVSIEVAPTAIYNAARGIEVGMNGCDMLLNIGGRCSTLIFADGNRVYMRSIPIAGDTITQQIAKEFDISFADAETLKRRHCFIALGGAYEEPDSETAATISKIARNVMTRLHGEINRSINQWRQSSNGSRPVRMLLSGGSSIIPYAPHFFCEKLNVPVEYLNVFPVVGISDDVDKEALTHYAPMFPELIGLGLREVADCPIQITLMPAAILRHEALQKKKPYLYVSAVVTILLLVVFIFIIGERTNYDMKRIEMTKGKVDETQKRVDRVGKALNAFKTADGNFNTAKDILRKRGQWFEILNAIQKALPDQMWLTAIAGEPETQSGANVSGGPMMMGMVKDSGGSAASAGDAELPEISQVVMYGHYVRFGDELLEQEFRSRLAESPLFDVENGFTYDLIKKQNEDNLNITSFIFRVELSNPLQQ